MLAKTTLSIAASFTLLVPSLLAQTTTFTQTDRSIIFPAQVFIQGDINRDGYPDFAFGLAASTNIYTLKSDTTGAYFDWTIPTQYCPSVPLGFGDFQRNGRNDFLVSTTAGPYCAGAGSGTFSNYLNDGTGIFPQNKTFAVVNNPANAAVFADINSDKKLDAIVNDANRLDLYYGDGYGNFAGPYLIAVVFGSAKSQTGNYYNLVTGDFDGNGCPDVAWIDNVGQGQSADVKVVYGDCHGGFTLPFEFEQILGKIDNLQTTDLNRDGVSDLVVTIDAPLVVSAPAVQVYYGQRSRNFTLSPFFTDPTLSGPIQVADFNGDGYPDIAYMSMSASGRSIKILGGRPDGALLISSESVLTGPADATPLELSSGDYNRDGKTDLALLAAGPGGSANNRDFTILTNTSPFPNGTCVPPISPGIHVCSPGLTSGTTVNVLAAATNANPTVFMELWVDGVKRIGYGSTHELRTSLTLPVGTHQFAYFSSDAAGNKNSLVTNVTVQ